MREIAPKLDPATTRLLVINMNCLVYGSSRWPMSLVNDCKVAIPLVAIRPEWEDPDKPACVTRSVIVEPDMRLGTIDELVAGYREFLEYRFNQINQDMQERTNLALTSASFVALDSGTLSPVFGGSTR